MHKKCPTTRKERKSGSERLCETGDELTADESVQQAGTEGAQERQTRDNLLGPTARDAKAQKG